MSANTPTPPLSNKERVKIPRQHMPEQDADRRRRNFEEVNQGLTVLGATTEALRCLAVHHAKVHCWLPGRSQGQGLRRA